MRVESKRAFPIGINERSEMMKPHSLAMALSVTLLSVASAAAHVVLERSETPVGKPYKAVFKVTHGCEGSPTVKVIINFPEGVIAVKPMPKPGWQITTEKAKYARSYGFYHGATLSEGVRSVVWSGGSLPDDFYDEFVVSAFIAGELKAGQTLAFPVTQECEKGEMRWSETAPSPEHQHHLKWPAPTLKLIPAVEHGGHHAAPAGELTLPRPDKATSQRAADVHRCRARRPVARRAAAHRLRAEAARCTACRGRSTRR